MLTKSTAIFLTVALGSFVALQPAINAEVARRLENGIGATFFSLSVSFAVMTVYLLISRPAVTMSGIAAAPWWIWMSGLIGVAFLFGGLTLTPVLGAALFFCFLVVGQIFGSAMADHFGLVGLSVTTVSPVRLIGLALVVAGAAIVALER